MTEERRKYEPKTSYYDHQKKALTLCYPHREFAYIMEAGCGKSKTLIDDFCIRFEFQGLQIVIIIAPAGMYANWVDKEIPQHMPERIRSRSAVHLWRGAGTVSEQKKLEFFLEEPRQGFLKILVIDTEAIALSKRAWEFLRKLVSVGKCMVAVDESSKIKNRDALVTKRLLDLRDIMSTRDHRRIMTGTPATKNPMDLYSQYEFLEKGYFGFNNFYSFRSRYCVTERINFTKKDKRIPGNERREEKVVIVDYKNLDELVEKMGRKSYIVRKQDCLDLPPKIQMPERMVEMTEEQRAIYSNIVDNACSELEDGQHITVTHILTKILRLHQLLCGVVVTDLGEQKSIDTKLPAALQEVLDETQGQNIIFCRYRHDVDMITERLRKMGRRYVEYHGGVADRDLPEAIRLFQSGAVDDFVGTVGKSSYGITLTNASSVIYYSCWYDLEKRLQSEDRAHRIGLKHPVSYYDLVHRDSVSQSILKTLRAQKNLADFVMRGPQSLRSLLTGDVEY